MATLSYTHKRQLRAMLERYANLTHWQRKMFLEDAGLRSLEPRLTMDAEIGIFWYQVVTLCEDIGKPAMFEDDALILLLRHVRNEMVAGHDDKVAQIEDMLSEHQLPPSVPVPTPSTTFSTAEMEYLVPDTLWQELLDAEEDRDWNVAIKIGEILREIPYKVRDTRQKLANAYLRRGQFYHKLKHFKRAILDFNRSIDLNLNQPEGWYWRGESYQGYFLLDGQTETIAQAISDYSRAITLNPSNASYYKDRSVAYHNALDRNNPVGDFGKAISDCSHAIKLDPYKAEYYDSRGATYHLAAFKNHAVGDYDKAIADSSHAIMLDPMNGEYYHARGLTYEAMGNLSAAQADYDKAKALGYKA